MKEPDIFYSLLGGTGVVALIFVAVTGRIAAVRISSFVRRLWRALTS